jgi:hypothetical protein
MEVWRGGISSRYVDRDKVSVSLAATGAHSGDTRKGARVRFILRVPHGKSRVHLWVPPKNFKQLAATMMRADPKAAEQAFLAAMLAQAKRRNS